MSSAVSWLACPSCRSDRAPVPLLVVGHVTLDALEEHLPPAARRVTLQLGPGGLAAAGQRLNGAGHPDPVAASPFHLAAHLLQLYQGHGIEPVLLVPTVLHLPDLLRLLDPKLRFHLIALKRVSRPHRHPPTRGLVGSSVHGRAEKVRGTAARTAAIPIPVVSFPPPFQPPLPAALKDLAPALGRLPPLQPRHAVQSVGQHLAGTAATTTETEDATEDTADTADAADTEAEAAVVEDTDVADSDAADSEDLQASAWTALSSTTPAMTLEEVTAAVTGNTTTTTTTSTSSTTAAKLSGKIAFCFMTDSNHEAPSYWTSFFSEASSSDYSIYCHAVNRDRVTDFLRSYLLKENVPSSSSTSIRVYVRLLQIAASDPDNQRFVLLSQNSIPAQTFESIQQALAEDQPYAGRGHSSTDTLRSRYANLASDAKMFISEEQFTQNEFETWAVWTRQQAEILSAGLLLYAFQAVAASEETYPGNLLALAGEDTQSWDSPSHYVTWTSGGQPQEYATGTTAFTAAYAEAQASGYLFMRKVYDPAAQLQILMSSPVAAYEEATAFTL